MEDSQKVIFNLNQFYYHSNNYEWTTEMPYYWFCFFKMDGDNCLLNEDFKLEGFVSLYTPLDKIGDLSALESDKKEDFIKIPESSGKKEISLKPIPVPKFVKDSTLKKPEPQVGCAVVFMNKSCFLSDVENQLAPLLASTVQNQLNELLSKFNYRKTALTNKTKSLSRILETVVHKATIEKQPFWKRFLSESKVDATIWKFSAGELEELNSISLTKNWTNEGTWELSGNISLSRNYPYPTFSPKTKSQQKEFSYQPD